MPYCIKEAGRKLSKVLEYWLLRLAGFYKFYCVSKLFIRRDKTRKVQLIITKITNDLFFAGSVNEMEFFAEEVGRCFETSKAIIDRDISFNGTTILQNRSGDIIMSMEAFMDKIRPIEIHAQRRNLPLKRENKNNIGLYRALTCKIIWLG